MIVNRYNIVTGKHTEATIPDDWKVTTQAENDTIQICMVKVIENVVHAIITSYQ